MGRLDTETLAKMNEVSESRERIEIGKRAIEALYWANRKIDGLERENARLRREVESLREGRS